MQKKNGTKRVSYPSRLFMILPAIRFYVTLEGGRNLNPDSGPMSGLIETKFLSVVAITVKPICFKFLSQKHIYFAVINILV